MVNTTVNTSSFKNICFLCSFAISLPIFTVYKCCITTELKFMKVLISAKLMIHMNVKFAITDTFKEQVLVSNHIQKMIVIIYCKKAMSFKGIAIIPAKGKSYKTFWGYE